MKTSTVLRILAVLLGLVIVAAACGDDDDDVTTSDEPAPTAAATPTRGDAGPDEAQTWTLASATVDTTDLGLLADAPITLLLVDDQATGTAACNSYTATAAIDGSSITLGPAVSTEMACDKGEIMNLERAYLAALGRVDTITTDDTSLTLSGDGVELVYG